MNEHDIDEGYGLNREHAEADRFIREHGIKSLGGESRLENITYDYLKKISWLKEFYYRIRRNPTSQ